MSGDLSNRDRVGQALELLGVALGRYVDERKTRRSTAGGNWKAAFSNDNVDSDPAALIGVILDNWPNVFRDELRGKPRTLLGETREWRNQWAHNEPFSGRDTERALDTIELFLTHIGAPEAGEVRKLKVSPSAPSPPAPAPPPRTPVSMGHRRTHEGPMPSGEGLPERMLSGSDLQKLVNAALFEVGQTRMMSVNQIYRYFHEEIIEFSSDVVVNGKLLKYAVSESVANEWVKRYVANRLRRERKARTEA